MNELILDGPSSLFVFFYSHSHTWKDNILLCTFCPEQTIIVSMSHDHLVLKSLENNASGSSRLFCCNLCHHFRTHAVLVLLFFTLFSEHEVIDSGVLKLNPTDLGQIWLFCRSIKSAMTIKNWGWIARSSASRWIGCLQYLLSIYMSPFMAAGKICLAVYDVT